MDAAAGGVDDAGHALERIHPAPFVAVGILQKSIESGQRPKSIDGNRGDFARLKVGVEGDLVSAERLELDRPVVAGRIGASGLLPELFFVVHQGYPETEFFGNDYFVESEGAALRNIIFKVLG